MFASWATFGFGAAVGAGVAVAVMLLMQPGDEAASREMRSPAGTAVPARAVVPAAASPTPSAIASRSAGAEVAAATSAVSASAPVVRAPIAMEHDEASPLPVPTVVRSPAAATRQGTAPESMQRKERDWARQYRRPAECDGNPSPQQLIECGNHHIRARREFDARYRVGSP